MPAEFIWICFERGFNVEEIKTEIKKVSAKVRKEQELRRGVYYLNRTINYILKRRQRIEIRSGVKTLTRQIIESP